jgi:hypothetical protein
MGGRGMLRYFGLVGLAYVISTLGAGLTDWLTRFDLSRTTNLLIAGGVGLLTALVLGAVDLAKSKGPEPARDALPVPPPGPFPGRPARTYPAGRHPNQGGHYPPARSGGGAGWVVTALALLLLCGGGAFALTTGVQWAADRLAEVATPPWLNRTKDPGVERLAESATATEGPLTVTVLGVRVNDEVTMVDLSAANTGGDTLRLPAFGYCQLDTAGRTLAADPAATQGLWAEAVPPGDDIDGTIVFDGRPPDGPGEVTLTFTQIFGGLGGPQTISVTAQLT